MSRVQITLFGALEVAHGNDMPRRPPTQKVVSLLGYLIAHRTISQSRSKLVGLLWPDLPMPQGRRMLSDALWRARRLLIAPGAEDTPLLQVERDTVTFQPGASIIDITQFAEAAVLVRNDAPITLDLSDFEPVSLSLSEGEVLQMAVQVYRGDFLEDCFDDWALIERELFREQHLALLRRLLSHYLASGAYDQALQTALQLVHADPLREEAHRVLMRCYWLLGRTTDAQRAYQQCVAVLENELGVAPDDATVALYVQLRERREGLGSDVPTPSAAPRPFVGRRTERVALLRGIESAIAGAGGVLLLTGETGSGKSHLLREVSAGASWRGAQISTGFGREEAQAVPFAPLRQLLAEALTPQRRQQLAATHASTLRSLALLLPPDDPRSATDDRHPSRLWSMEGGRAAGQAQQLYEAIASTLLALGELTPQIVILEDLPWFDTATLEALGYVLHRLHGSHVLVVLSGRSDELQQIPAIWDLLLQLDRDGVLTRVQLSTLSVDECSELVRRTLEVRDVPELFCSHLHSTTGGNPFFILETLRALGEQGLLERDADGHWQIPEDTQRTNYQGLPLATSLRQIIGARLQRLSASDRNALAAAAVLGQQCTPSILERMVNGGPKTEDRRPGTEEIGLGSIVVEAEIDPSSLGGHPSSVVGHPSIDELLRRQFLVEERDGYRFGHETLRETVYAQLDRDERQQLHLRAAEALEHEHFAGVEALAQHFYRAGAWKESQPYLVQAGDRAVAVCAYRDALQRYQQALEAIEHLPSDDTTAMRCDVQLKRAEVAMVLGNYLLAQSAYEHVLALTEQIGRDPTRRRHRIQSLNGLCAVLSLTNAFERAAATMRQARALADAWPELRSRAATYYQAGSFCYHVDNYLDAQTYLQQALELYESLESEEGQAHCLELLAWTWRRHEGVTDRVLHGLQQAMRIYTQCDDQYRQRRCTVSLANVYLLRGALNDVLESCAAVLPFFRATDTRYTISECQYFRGVALLAMGRFEEALAANREAYTISVELGIAAAGEVNQIFMGKALAALGNLDEARQHLLAASVSHDRLVRPRALMALAELSLATGDHVQAFEYAQSGLTLMQMVGSQPFLGMMLRVLGRLRTSDTQQLPESSNGLPDAAGCFQQSIALLERACMYGELGLSWSAYGAFLLQEQRFQEAEDALRKASELLQRTDQLPALEQVRELQKRQAAVLLGVVQAI